MIDLIRLRVNDKSSFENEIKEIIDLKSRFNSDTGELYEYPKRGRYNTLEIKITENIASVWGSLHKFYNSINDYGIHNYNDFNTCETEEAICYLNNFLHIEKNATLTGFEFGFNIEIDRDPQQLINNCILMYDYCNASRDDKFDGRGDYLEFKKTDYSIKIYNKSKQFKLKSRNVIRLELKITNSRYFKKMGIYCFHDLINKSKLKTLFNRFLECFDKLTIVDANKLDSVTSEVIFKYGNPIYWKQLRYSGDYRKMNRKKKEFESFLIDNNLTRTKDELRNLVELKFDELIECNTLQYFSKSVA